MEKNINMLFAGLGHNDLEKTVNSVLGPWPVPFAI